MTAPRLCNLVFGLYNYWQPSLLVRGRRTRWKPLKPCLILLWRFIHPGNLNTKCLNFSRMYLDCLGSFQSLLRPCSPRLWCCSRTWSLRVDVPRYHVVVNRRQIVPSPIAVKWWVKCSYIDSLFNPSLKPFRLHCLDLGLLHMDCVALAAIMDVPGNFWSTWARTSVFVKSGL